MAFKSKTCRQLLFLALFWAYPAWLGAVTPPIPAQPSQYVVDLAGVLDAGTRARLNAMLRGLEVNTTAQVVVLTLDSLEGEPLETFSHETAVKWGIGQKGKDNGVLLTVAVKDRKYRIEVGYGLEATLPDSLVGSIGREYLVPNFKKGDFAAGIVAAVTQIVNKIAPGQIGGTPGADTGRIAPQPETGRPAPAWVGRSLFSVLTPILFIVFFILLRVLLGRNRKGGRGGFFFFGSGGGWSSGGSGSGGFGGGGGGDFGGGGASGDW